MPIGTKLTEKNLYQLKQTDTNENEKNCLLSIRCSACHNVRLQRQSEGGHD
jgi:hypothetical protein